MKNKHWMYLVIASVMIFAAVGGYVLYQSNVSQTWEISATTQSYRGGSYTKVTDTNDFAMFVADDGNKWTKKWLNKSMLPYASCLDANNDGKNDIWWDYWNNFNLFYQQIHKNKCNCISEISVEEDNKSTFWRHPYLLLKNWKKILSTSNALVSYCPWALLLRSGSWASDPSLKLTKIGDCKQEVIWMHLQDAASDNSPRSFNDKPTTDSVTVLFDDYLPLCSADVIRRR